MSQKKQELKIKEGTKVFSDPKTHAKTIAIPFRLPDTTAAVLMVTRLKDEEWEPNRIIKKIDITYA